MRRWPVILLCGVGLAGSGLLARAVPQARGPIFQEVPYSLPQGVSIGLPSDWIQQDEGPPPSPLLTGSAPPLVFEKKLTLASQVQGSMLEVGVSNNIFLRTTVA